MTNRPGNDDISHPSRVTPLKIDRATRTALENAAKTLSTNVSAAQLVGAQFSRQYADMFSQLSRITTPKVDIPQIKLPALSYNYAELFPNFSSVMDGLSRQLLPAFEAIRQVQRSQLGDVLKRVVDSIKAGMPPNWREATGVKWAIVETMTLDEGLALGWVPETEILNLLLSANDGAARRRLIGRRWKRIVRHCNLELMQVRDRRLKRHARFAQQAAEALLGGSASASQALSANLLDTVLRQHFTEPDRRRLIGQKSRLSVDDFTIRRAIVLGGIWGAFGEYWPTQGDPIPTKFSRHASAHAVHPRQFSRINATIALMHVTSLVRLLDHELSS